MKKSPVVHPFCRKMMTKFIQERVKTLTNKWGEGGGGGGGSLGHRKNGEDLIVCDTDKGAEFTHSAMFWRGVLYLSAL